MESVILDGLHLKFRLSFYQFRRGAREVLSSLRGVVVGGEQGRVKYTVNGP